jgi:predicted nucleotidyltransferase
MLCSRNPVFLGEGKMNEIMIRYLAAVDSFVEKVKDDPNVIAVIVYGSVAQGTVWEKSDVDVMLVVRDQNLLNDNYGIYEDNITFGLEICRRSDLKRTIEKALTGSVGHSFSTTCKIVYTRDESLYEYFEENKTIGKSDMDKAVFNSVNWLIGLMEKIEKWLVVKNDVIYARYYVLKAADVIAQIEVTSRGKIPTREAILQAAELNPRLIETFYTEPMNRIMDENEIRCLLRKMDEFIATHMEAILNVTGDYFGDGEIKTGTMISRHFNSNMHFLHPILDYLCDRGYLDKISQTIRITPKSKLSVEEVAFIMPQYD